MYRVYADGEPIQAAAGHVFSISIFYKLEVIFYGLYTLFYIQDT